MGRKDNPGSGGWSMMRRYSAGAIVLFILLTGLITIVLLSKPPIYTSRSTLRIANSSPLKMMEPVAWLTSDSVEDEMAVLESLTAREHVAEELHLACKLVPDWQPNPFLYQVQRISSMLFKTPAPTNYAYLNYPIVTQLEMDYPKVRGADLKIKVSKDGSYSLTRKGKTEGTAQIGQPLTTNGLTIALDGFTPDKAQSWKLAITEPERIGIELLDGLSIFRVGARSYTIGVRFQDAHPELAARVVDSLVTFFMERDLNISQEVSSESLSFVEKQITSVRGELDELRAELKDLLKGKNNLLAASNAAALVDNYMASGTALNQLRTEKAQYDALLSQLDSDEEFLGYYDPKGAGRSLETDLIEGIMQTEVELGNELQTKTEQHPDVIKLQDKLANQKTDLRSLLNESLAQVNRQVKAAEQDSGKYRSLLDLSPGATTEVNRLEAEILIRSQTLGTLYSEQQRAKLQQIAAISSIRMLDPAVPDREHISPRILQSGLTAVVFSAFVTIALLLGLRLVDSSVRTPADLSSRFNVPVLATLKANGSEGRDLELSRLRTKLAQLAAQDVGAVGIVSTASGEAAANVSALVGKVQTGSPAIKAVHSAETGLTGVFDTALAQVDHLLIVAKPGSRRLNELAPLVDEIADLNKQLVGFILLES